MKKQILLTILFLNSVLTFAQVEWKTINGANFTIEYPSNWELNESGTMGSKFILFSQPTSELDKFRENVNFMSQDLTGLNINLDKFVEISENQIKTMVTNGKLIESKRVSNSNMEYHKFVYTGDQGIYNLKFIQYFWVIANESYILTFTGEITEFEKFTTVRKKILDSFKLIIK